MYPKYLAYKIAWAKHMSVENWPIQNIVTHSGGKGPKIMLSYL